jgi:hypothetical protein
VRTLRSRPLQIWKGPKSYHRWDGLTGWLWACWICQIEAATPCATQPSAYAEAIGHLEDEHLGGTGV